MSRENVQIYHVSYSVVVAGANQIGTLIVEGNAGMPFNPADARQYITDVHKAPCVLLGWNSITHEQAMQFEGYAADQPPEPKLKLVRCNNDTSTNDAASPTD